MRILWICPYEERQRLTQLAGNASNRRGGEKIVFFSVLNTTMFNVSLPDIAEKFHLFPSQVSWVVSGYVIIFAIGSVTYGRLADTYAIKAPVGERGWAKLTY